MFSNGPGCNNCSAIKPGPIWCCIGCRGLQLCGDCLCRQPTDPLVPHVYVAIWHAGLAAKSNAPRAVIVAEQHCGESGNVLCCVCKATSWFGPFWRCAACPDVTVCNVCVHQPAFLGSHHRKHVMRRQFGQLVLQTGLPAGLVSPSVFHVCDECKQPF